MKIAVLMKQVVSCGDNTVETGGALRSAENTSINPSDMYALATAITQKRKDESEIWVFTMGPAHASEILIEACRLGADYLYRISDPLYGGSDTFVTAKILKRALDMCGPFDLILAGEKAIDGETGQVPGALAAFLDIPFATSVIEMNDINEDTLQCQCLIEGTLMKVEMEKPCILAISCGVRGIEYPIVPSLKDLVKAKNAEMVVLDNAELGFLAEEVGFTGSLTQVRRVQKILRTRESKKIDSVDEAVAVTLKELSKIRGAQ